MKYCNYQRSDGIQTLFLLLTKHFNLNYLNILQTIFKTLINMMQPQKSTLQLVIQNANKIVDYFSKQQKKTNKYPYQKKWENKDAYQDAWAMQLNKPYDPNKPFDPYQDSWTGTVGRTVRQGVSSAVNEAVYQLVPIEIQEAYHFIKDNYKWIGIGLLLSATGQLPAAVTTTLQAIKIIGPMFFGGIQGGLSLVGKAGKFLFGNKNKNKNKKQPLMIQAASDGYDQFQNKIKQKVQQKKFNIQNIEKKPIIIQKNPNQQEQRQMYLKKKQMMINNPQMQQIDVGFSKNPKKVSMISKNKNKQGRAMIKRKPIIMKRQNQQRPMDIQYNPNLQNDQFRQMAIGRQSTLAQ